jgi:hypothetical protein
VPPATSHRRRAQESAADRNTGVGRKCAHDLQHPQFRFDVQTVTGFDFYCRHAFADQGIQSCNGSTEQFLIAGGPGRVDRRHDAATGARDIFIRHALQSLLEFGRAIAGEYEVRMTVD